MVIYNRNILIMEQWKQVEGGAQLFVFVQTQRIYEWARYTQTCHKI